MPSETRRCLHKSEYSGNLFQVGRLAQLARAPRLHRGCQGFESLIAHRIKSHDSLKSREIFLLCVLAGSWDLADFGCGCCLVGSS